MVVTTDRETGDEAVDPKGSDELLASGDTSGLDMDWQAAALDNDSFADVGGGGRAMRGSTSTGSKRRSAG